MERTQHFQRGTLAINSRDTEKSYPPVLQFARYCGESLSPGGATSMRLAQDVKEIIALRRQGAAESPEQRLLQLTSGVPPCARAAVENGALFRMTCSGPGGRCHLPTGAPFP